MNEALFFLRSIAKDKAVINDMSPEVLAQVREAFAKSDSARCSIEGRPSRVMRLRSTTYEVIAVAFDKDRIRSKNLLRTECALMLGAADDFEATIDSAVERAQNHTRRLIHNLRSLSAKTTQEIFYIARQDKMVDSPTKMRSYIRDEVLKNPDEVASAFVAILKHQAAQSAEFSAFQKLSGDVGQLKPEAHSLHKVLMGVGYLFFGEFTERHVRVDVDKTQLYAVFDYESIHVCVYHLFENAAKYCRPGSQLSVTFRVRDNQIEISFDMESLSIPIEEASKIFLEGYSGRVAKRNNLEGSGIGLYVARQLAQMNGGILTVLPGGSTIKGDDYSRNRFILTVPKEGRGNQSLQSPGGGRALR